MDDDGENSQRVNPSQFVWGLGPYLKEAIMEITQNEPQVSQLMLDIDCLGRDHLTDTTKFNGAQSSILWVNERRMTETGESIS